MRRDKYSHIKNFFNRFLPLLGTFFSSLAFLIPLSSFSGLAKTLNIDEISDYILPIVLLLAFLSAIAIASYYFTIVLINSINAEKDRKLQKLIEDVQTCYLDKVSHSFTDNKYGEKTTHLLTHNSGN